MAKVTVIGAGNVGATCANAIAHTGCVSDIVLIDIKEGISEGKAI
ncbi:MAG: malate dehydrogenase, partial [Bacteroidales bacterium]|nr:malate dehydrogenase [Bacteroidales bacterium]